MHTKKCLIKNVFIYLFIFGAAIFSVRTSRFFSAHQKAHEKKIYRKKKY